MLKTPDVFWTSYSFVSPPVSIKRESYVTLSSGSSLQSGRSISDSKGYRSPDSETKLSSLHGLASTFVVVIGRLSV